MANAPDCPIVDFIRRLKRTRALKNIEILAGSPSLPRQTSPGRIVIWPFEGKWKDPSDKSIAIADVEQQIIAECWGKGSPTTAGADEQALQDMNVTWLLLQQLARALEEQGANSGVTPNDPGYYWRADSALAWNDESDTSTNGTSVKVLFSATVPVLAASDDQGHVGDNWPFGVAEAVDIQRSPVP